MSKFSVSSPVFNCPIEKAFDYVSNVDNRPQWQRQLDAVDRQTPLPDGEGTAWEEYFQMLGMKQKAKLWYTDFQRPNLFVEGADLPLCTGRIDMIFESVEGGCRLTVVGDVQWKWPYRIATPLLVSTFKKMVSQDLLDIKNQLEAT